MNHIDRIRLGNLGDWKSVGGGVFELRIDLGPGYRLYFAIEEIGAVLILCGGDKSSQASDIMKARKYWKDYVERRHGKT